MERDPRNLQAAAPEALFRLLIAATIFTAIGVYRYDQAHPTHQTPGRFQTLTAAESDCSRSSLFALGSGCGPALGKVTFMSVRKK